MTAGSADGQQPRAENRIDVAPGIPRWLCLNHRPQRVAEGEAEEATSVLVNEWMHGDPVGKHGDTIGRNAAMRQGSGD